MVMCTVPHRTMVGIIVCLHRILLLDSLLCLRAAAKQWLVVPRVNILRLYKEALFLDLNRDHFMDKRVYAKGLINLDERAEFRILILDVNFIVLLKPECGLGP